MTRQLPHSKLRLSALAMAVTCAFYGPSYALAQEQNSNGESAQNTLSSAYQGHLLAANVSSVSAGASAASGAIAPARAAAAPAAAPAAPAAAAAATTAAASADANNASTENAASVASATSTASAADAQPARQRQSFSAPVTPRNNTMAAAAAASMEASASATVVDPEDPIEQAKQERLQAVTNFATAAYTTMVGNVTTQKYLQNKYLAASSTFPLRLTTRLRANPWRPAPFLPVPERDLACYYGIPPYRVPQDFDINTTPVEISADEVTGSIDNAISYSGNVTITQGDKTLKTDSATYNSATGEVSAVGNITVQGPELTVTSRDKMTSNLNTQISELHEAQFQLNGSVASGQTQKITLDNENRMTTIEGLSFTTCPVGDNSWHLESDEVELVQGEAYGEAYGNVLYIKDVPVFYLPYVNFPISNKRKSGLLYPSFALSSSSGFEYEQPIYFNIAPNYDYTLSPRIMTKRGLLLQNEFRYMPWAGTYGEFNLDYIPQDNDWQLEHDGGDERYMMRLYHESYFFNNDLSVIIDYQRVRTNDYDYLDDIGSQEAKVTDDHLKQSLVASYDRSKYHISVETRDYQRLIPDNLVYNRPFALLPQVKAQYYDTYGPFTFDIQGNATQFTGSSDSEAAHFSATRLHIEPDIAYQIFNNRGTSVTANARGFFTYYNQDDLDKMPAYYTENLGFRDLDGTTTRSLYLLQLKGKTTLERKVLDLRHTQTLEPEIQYQYIPYEDQDNIALYDTTDRMTDYYSNFSFRHFTGYDRIPDLNHISVGLTSRLLDTHDRELMRVGLSQSYAIVPTRVTLNPNDPDDMNPRSPLSFFFNASPIQGMTTNAAITYNNETNSISSWNAMAQYQNEDGLLVQVSYRFTDQGNRSFSNNIIDLKQVGLVASVPLGDKFSFTAASYRDIEQNNDINTKLALKYEECCWSLAFVYESYNSCDWDSLERERDHSIGIQFEFKGIGAVNITGSSDKNFTNTRLLDHFDPTNLSQ